MAGNSQRAYFFDAGLRFACQQCGACCTGAPGVVRVRQAEIGRIAEFLQMASGRFTREYLVYRQDVHSIGEHPDGRCRLYGEGGCRIYPVRPRQCRTYPFWFSLLRSEGRWRREARSCPGIGRGRLYTREQILERVGADLDDRRDCSPVENHERRISNNH